MNLTLIGTKVLNLDFSQFGGPEEADYWVPDDLDDDKNNAPDSYALKFHVAYSPDEADKYAIIFEFNSKLPSQSIQINLSYIAEFKSDMDITEDFKKSIFPRQNSPAIAFPFLRAFVSNLLLSSGYRPMILPSINFQALDKTEQNKE